MCMASGVPLPESEEAMVTTRLRIGVTSPIIALLAAGCATIITGTKDQVRIVSTPPGATVELQGQVLQTPATVTLSRSFLSPDHGRAVPPGYQDANFTIAREFNLWTIGNVVTLGLGTAVDVLSGAILRYPDQHHVLLHEKE